MHTTVRTHKGSRATHIHNTRSNHHQQQQPKCARGRAQHTHDTHDGEATLPASASISAHACHSAGCPLATKDPSLKSALAPCTFPFFCNRTAYVVYNPPSQGLSCIALMKSESASSSRPRSHSMRASACITHVFLGLARSPFCSSPAALSGLPACLSIVPQACHEAGAQHVGQREGKRLADGRQTDAERGCFLHGKLLSMREQDAREGDERGRKNACPFTSCLVYLQRWGAAAGKGYTPALCGFTSVHFLKSARAASMSPDLVSSTARHCKAE